MRGISAVLCVSMALAAGASAAGARRYPLPPEARLRAETGRYVLGALGLEPEVPLAGAARLASSGAAKPDGALDALARDEGLAPLEIAVPLDAVHPLWLRRGGVSIEEWVAGARRVDGEVDRGLVAFPGTLESADALVVADPEWVESAFYLKDRHAPRAIELRLRLRRARLRSAPDGGLEARNEAGAALLRLEPPTVIDADGRRGRGRWVLERLDAEHYHAFLFYDREGLRFPILVAPRWASPSR